MTEEFPTRYDQNEAEPRIYGQWEKSGYFNPDRCIEDGITKPEADSFTIIMPPPNANGHLHAGHAMFVTVEDIMTRYQRMKGKKTLWLPGADHAGFETQVVYEKKLEKEGRSRFQLSREELYEEILTFTRENKKHMEDEIRSLGASCDWSREKFTLDPDIVTQVHATFKKLYDDGLAYRGKRIVSWCPKHQTSFSDLEITDVERVDPFYYFQYGPFVIGTSRPETKFGDKYVVMHPDDERYKDYSEGQKIDLEWINGPITATVIKDEAIDREFGSGVMTITPWHDAVDFGIAERHNLDREQVIDERGRLLPIAGEFAGMKIDEARSKIVDKLRGKGLVVKVEEKYSHVVRTCYKCGSLIEPQIKEQWFIKTKPLAEKAIQAIVKNEITFVPDHYKKICLHWLENIIDWNISRQIVWGIPIPAYFCLGCGQPRVEKKSESRWFLVRHGETDYNKEKRGMGQLDIPLNDEGRAQANATAEQFKKEKIDLIISSDLARCRETAEAIANATGAEIIFDEALRERYYGEAEGLLQSEVIEKYGNPLQYEMRIPGSETYQDVEERVWPAFQKHKEIHGKKNVVIVSHGGAIRMLVKRIKNQTPQEAMEMPSRKNTEVVTLDINEPCNSCGSHFYQKDIDTFDTWFSSGQWPFLTLDYPNGKDFKTYYPTSVMETAGEIIFFWVTRMIMLGLYVTNRIPFHTVYLHGLVLDAKGKKMSKSKGNVINPLEITNKYGTDALRMALVMGNTPGTSLALSEDRVKGYRNFATKIWNASRFVMMSKPQSLRPESITPTEEDKAIIAEFQKIKKEVSEYIENYDFHLASETAYHYFWHTFADKIIEASKPRLKSENTDDQWATYDTLEHILLGSLKMLHPFMPFVTEEIYQKFHSGKLLMVQSWDN